MRKHSNNVKIEGPPIKEIKKKSCAKNACITGCGCFVLLIVVLLALLKFSASPRSKELKDLPNDFLDKVPVYDISNIHAISFVSGKDKGRELELAAMIPKIVLSPVMLVLNKYDIISIDSNTANLKNKDISWNNFLALIKSPVGEYNDTIMIDWRDLPASPDFVYDYYKSEFEKRGFKTITSIHKDEMMQFSFTSDEIEGAFYLEDRSYENGTDIVYLTVNIPSN